MLNRFTRAKQAQADMTAFLRTNPTCIFEGDSIDLASSIYKNENLDIYLRFRAAVLASSFERPRLNAVASVTKHIDGDDAAFAKLFQQIEQRLALAPPEARGQVIDMLSEESEDSR